ncbi:hypothetical protein BU16DRAFT_530196 [Lophium mytilinum]|uniref:Uncharacterized protein n=1 Tax=Lophium mytilinum TaxID=390894 RepID=A0A6A6QH61_9PEZI|nr:hypothetical protein BU16DRAFT_530196 [Lophium mytilinum]
MAPSWLGSGSAGEELAVFCFPFILVGVTLIVIWLWMSANDGYVVNPYTAISRRIPGNTRAPRYSQAGSSESEDRTAPTGRPNSKKWRGAEDRYGEESSGGGSRSWGVGSWSS